MHTSESREEAGGLAARMAAKNDRMDATGAAADRRWMQVMAREDDAAFVYGVRTTGVFCRPSCPSRRPARVHVLFFPGAPEARAAGFRPCLRCRPEHPSAASELVREVAAFLAAHLDGPVSLAELARLTGRSPWTVQRVFSRVTGLSPRAYAHALRARLFRAELQRTDGKRVTDAIYAAGFSGPSQAGAQAPLGMAARRYRARGLGERIGYVLGSSNRCPGSSAEDSANHRAGASGPFAAQDTASGPGATAAAPAIGLVLVASTARGICAVLLGDSTEALLAELRERFPAAELAPDPSLEPQLRAVLGGITEGAEARELPLDLRATAFQARVWAALAAIPRGETRSYGEIAQAVGSPKAVRAVARACAGNPAALLVPCHRAVGADGSLTGYRWGLERKRALLAWERGDAPGY